MSSIERVQPGYYLVRGTSGAEAGFIQKMLPRGWLLSLRAMPQASFEYLRDAQLDALKQAERY
jgi:hypothetical protein